jgi:ankyrin repeat protein
MPASKEDIDALFRLCKSGTTDADFVEFKKLLKNPENTSILQVENLIGWTPLMVAAFYGNKEYVREIVNTNKALQYSPRLKYFLHHQNSSGATALDLTTDEEIIQILTLEKERQKRLLEKPVIDALFQGLIFE